MGRHHHGHHHSHHHSLHDDFSPNGSRSLRNRKMSRRLMHQNNQAKRLFTPEIKRYLKNWLVRRRKNPYPSRSEKKDLAVKTGLTYVQICNWFANWRRKLKNTCRGREATWGNLIKGYNVNARGNVEQFSISSDDSIWEDRFNIGNIDSDDSDTMDRSTGIDHSYFNNSVDSKINQQDSRWKHYGGPEFNNNRGEGLLGRWLESAAKYRGQWGKQWPRGDTVWARSNWSKSEHHRTEYTHSVSQNKSEYRLENKHEEYQTNRSESSHNYDYSKNDPITKPIYKYRHREELDAAEALTFLSTACG